MTRVGAAIGLAPGQMEIQMLYGIRTDQQRRLARAGYDVRALIAYGVGLVSVVHAPARRAAGQRLVRPAPDAAVVTRAPVGCPVRR